MVTRRVLVIDDEADVRDVVQGCLEDIGGWDVMTAPSGQEGLTCVIAEKPDAIVLDVMMPGMDGLTFLEQLRSTPEVNQTPVVLLTAKVSLTTPQAFIDLQVAGAISKPFNPFLLVDQVATCLGWDLEADEPEC